MCIRDRAGRGPALLMRHGAAIAGLADAVPAGVALRLPLADETARFEVAILDRQGRALLTLGGIDEEDVVATWRALGAASGLPLVIAHPDGNLAVPLPQVGRVLLGPIRIRRRHGLLSGRRPRFLVRRKTGTLPLRPRIHREREIAGGRI